MEVANSTGGPPNPASRSRPKETLGEMYDKLVRQKEHSERTGTWFWPHLEPTAFSKDGQITSVRLQCLHCQQHMAASNPSRTATEHLRSGACKKFKEKHVCSSYLLETHCLHRKLVCSSKKIQMVSQGDRSKRCLSAPFGPHEYIAPAVLFLHSHNQMLRKEALHAQKQAELDAKRCELWTIFGQLTTGT